jgi:uncharacterized linocin/CFP29 family protein
MIIYNPEGVPLTTSGVESNRPYIDEHGRSVIAVNTGRRDSNGNFIYQEQQFRGNATLRKDEWIQLDDAAIESARERLVIAADLMSMGLTHNAGGLGTIISEWEKMSEMTDAEVTMDGESMVTKDRQLFGIDGVPVPIIHKDHKIGERTLLASRTRGASLDVTQSAEAGRSVARRTESMIFNGLNLGASNSAGDSYQVYGLTNHPNKAVDEISDWAAGGTSEETIFDEILNLVEELETEQRAFGPFTLYIPNTYAKRFRQDFKAETGITLRQRVLATEVVRDIRTSDVLADGNVILIELTSRVIDLTIASDVVNIQWQSGSGFTNHFKTYAAWAPRIKTDYDGRVGFIHGATST